MPDTTPDIVSNTDTRNNQLDALREFLNLELDHFIAAAKQQRDGNHAFSLRQLGLSIDISYRPERNRDT